MPYTKEAAVEAAASAARQIPGLELLLLFGSQARNDATSSSDWDFGYLADAPFDFETLLAGLVTILNCDRVDLVDLTHASGLLRYRAARDGLLVFEARPGVANKFRLEAAQFWCDAEPILRRGYETVLARLKA